MKKVEYFVTGTGRETGDFCKSRIRTEGSCVTGEKHERSETESAQACRIQALSALCRLYGSSAWEAYSKNAADDEKGGNYENA